MFRGDRGLKRIDSDAAGGHGPLHQGFALGNECTIPEAAILRRQQHQPTVFTDARSPSRRVQHHQCQQPHHLGIRQQREKQSRQADRLGRQLLAFDRVPGGRAVAFVEHQVDHLKHAVQSLWQLGMTGHHVGDAGIAQPMLGADDALRDGRCRHEKRPRDFLGGQVADLAQRQCDPGVRRQCRMAAREHQAQAIILDLVVFALRRVGVRSGEPLHDGLEIALETRIAAQAVNGFEATGGDQPGARILRHP